MMGCAAGVQSRVKQGLLRSTVGAENHCLTPGRAHLCSPLGVSSFQPLRLGPGLLLSEFVRMWEVEARIHALAYGPGTIR